MDVALLVFLIVALFIAVGLLAGREKLTQSEKLGWQFYAGFFFGALTLGLLFLVVSNGLLQNAYDWLINGECDCEGITGAELFYYISLPLVTLAAGGFIVIQAGPAIETLWIKKEEKLDTRFSRLVDNLAPDRAVSHFSAIEQLNYFPSEVQTTLGKTESVGRFTVLAAQALIGFISNVNLPEYNFAKSRDFNSRVSLRISSGYVGTAIKAIQSLRKRFEPNTDAQFPDLFFVAPYFVKDVFTDNIDLKDCVFVQGIYSDVHFTKMKLNNLTIDGYVNERIKFIDCELSDIVMTFRNLGDLKAIEQIDKPPEAEIIFENCNFHGGVKINGKKIAASTKHVNITWHDPFVEVTDHSRPPSTT